MEFSIRLLDSFGSREHIINTINNISDDYIITQEDYPYLHYHIHMVSDKARNMLAIRKQLYKHRIAKTRGRNDIYVEPVKNTQAHFNYIKKDKLWSFTHNSIHKCLFTE